MADGLADFVEDIQPVQGAQQPERVAAPGEVRPGLTHRPGRVGCLVQAVDPDTQAGQGPADEFRVGTGVAAGERDEQDPAAVAQDGPERVSGVLEERHPGRPRVREQQQFGHLWHSSGRPPGLRPPAARMAR
jgi:hypothetical protein